MARLTFPDEGSRSAFRTAPSGRPLTSAAGAAALVYLDAGATTLADIQTTAGAAIAGSSLNLDAYSRFPLFLGPADGTDTLYVVVDGGPVSPMYARVDDRLDAVKATADAAETPAGAQAKATAAQAAAVQRANHTGTQSADTLTDGTTNKAFLATERTKLSGVATGATANSADATLLARANHTGTQLAATVSDFSTAVVTAASGAYVAVTDGALLGRPTVNGAPVQRKGVLRFPVVAARCKTPGKNSASGSVSTTGTARQAFFVVNDCTDVRVVFAHFNVLGGLEADAAGTATFKASLVMADGTKLPFTFGGLLTATVSGGTIASDPLGVDLVAGTQVFVDTYQASGTMYATVTGDSNLNEGRTATTDLTARGSAAPSGSGAYQVGPAALTGTPTSTNPKPAVAFVGDSIAHGAQDYQPASVGGGFLVTAFAGRSTAAKNPTISVAAESDQVTYWTTTGGAMYRMPFVSDAKYAICELGVNDFGSSSRSTATVQANATALWRSLAKRGVIPFQTTITPATATSSDTFTTVSGQTANGTNAARTAFNDWLRAGAPLDPTTLLPVAVGTAGGVTCNYYDTTGTLSLTGTGGHYLRGVFEVADIVESVRNSGKWAIPAGLRTVTDVTMSSGTGLFNSTSAAFVAGDVGKAIRIAGAGAAGADLVSVITAVNSATQARVQTNSSTAVSGATANIGLPTQDGLHPSGQVHNLMAAAIPTGLFV